LVATDYLSSRGIQVDFVTPFLQVSPELPTWEMAEEMFSQLVPRGVRFWPGYQVKRGLGSGEILAADVQTAEEKIFKGIELVVGAVGSISESALAKELRGKVQELYVIGDANIPQTVEVAVYQGGLLGRQL